MSGHSKWATTKHRKGAQDAKRSALFSKLSRNITVAARLGGDPLPENNASLAAAVAKAKAQSMPKDKIKSAVCWLHSSRGEDVWKTLQKNHGNSLLPIESNFTQKDVDKAPNVEQYR